MSSSSQQLLLGVSSGESASYWAASAYNPSIYSLSYRPFASAGPSGRVHVAIADISTPEFGTRQYTLDKEGAVVGLDSMHFDLQEDSLPFFMSHTGGDTTGNQYVLDYLTDSGVFLIKYGLTGTLIWSRQIVPLSGATVRPQNYSHLVVTADGDCYVGVNQYDATNGYGSLLARIDANGNLQWQRKVPNFDVRGLSLTSSGLVALMCALAAQPVHFVKYSTSGVLQSSVQVTTFDASYALINASLGVGDPASPAVPFSLDCVTAIPNDVQPTHVGLFNASTMTITVSRKHPKSSTQHESYVAYDYTNNYLYVATKYDTNGDNVEITKFDASMNNLWTREIAATLFMGSISVHKDKSILVCVGYTQYYTCVLKLPNDGSLVGIYGLTCGAASVTLYYTAEFPVYVSYALTLSASSVTDVAGNFQFTTYGAYGGGVSATHSVLSLPVPPLAYSYWAQSYDFSTLPTQRTVYTAEKQSAGNSVVIAQKTLGYAAFKRGSNGRITIPVKEYTLSGVNFAYGEDVKLSPNGGYVVGVRVGTATTTSMTFNKHADNGDIEWTRYLSVADTTQAKPPCFVLGSDSSLYTLVQPSFNIPNGWGTLIKTSSTGMHQWCQSNGANLVQLNQRSLAIDSSDNLYLCYPGQGYYDPPPALSGMSLSKISSAGVGAWCSLYGFVDNYPADSVKFNGNGGWGITVDPATGDSYTLAYANTTLSGQSMLVLFKLNSSGVLQWMRKLTRPGATNHYCGDIILVGSELVFLMQYDTTNLVVKTNLSGDLTGIQVITCGTSLSLPEYGNLASDGQGNIVISGIGTNYVMNPARAAGFSFKVPVNFTKPGAWMVSPELQVTAYNTTLSTLTMAAGPPDTTLITVDGIGIQYYELLNGDNTFTSATIDMVTLTTDIP